MSSIELKRLARRIAQVEREQANQGKPQLAYSSIENGNLKSYEGGDLKMIVGLQDDGGQAAQVFNGPTPPTPVGFTVEVDHGKFILHWFGDFDGDALAPSDWSRAEVHASQDPFFVPSRATARGSIVSAAGGEVTIGVLKGPWTIKMLAWSQAGKMSAPSAPVDVEVPGYGDIVLEEIDAATTLIKNAGEMLIEGQQTLADKLAGIADLDPEEISDEIAQARQEAIDAALAEIANVEGALTSAIGGKSSTKWSTSNPPVNYDGAVGDTWVKLTSLGSGGREVRRSRWQGDVWVDHPVDGAVLSNVDASTITTGFLDVVNRIRAGAILADKLLIGGPTNLVPGLREGTNRGLSNFEWDEDEQALTPTYPGKTTVYADEPLYLEPGKYLISADIKSSAPTRTYIGLLGVDTGYKYRYGISNVEVGPEWQHFEATLTILEDEAGNAMFRFLPAYSGDSTAVTWYRNISMRPMVGGTLIEPGGIQTPHLAADVLEVGNLKAGTAALAEAVIKKLFAEVVVARMAQAEEFIGENAILTGAVTAPKITASEELTAKFAEFLRVRAEMLEADAIDSMVITGPTIQSARSGQRWVGDQSGIRVFDENDDVRTQLAPGRNSFKGEVEADTLVTNGGAEFRSANNVLAQGARLTLAAGVTDPTAPPMVHPFWEGAEFEPEALNGKTDYVGLAWDGSNYITASSANVGKSQYDRLWGLKIDPTTGQTEPMIIGPTQTEDGTPFRVSEVFGVTCIGSELFWLGRNVYAGWVWVTDLGGAYQRRLKYEDLGYSSSNPLGYKPGIGNDGTNVVIAHCADAGRLIIRTYNKTTGAQIGSNVSDSNDLTRSDITGVHVGVADWGRKLATVAKSSSNQLPSFHPTTGVYDGGGASFSMAATGSTGVVFHDGAFHTLDPSGHIHEYADVNTGDNSGDWWAAYQWAADTTPEDSTITNWSRISPPTRFTWPRRAMIKIIGQPLPTGVDMIGPALAKKTTTPARTDFHQPTWQIRAGQPVAWYDTLPTGWENGFTPRDENNFPEAESSVLETASKTFRLQGDGSGRWGPLEFLPGGGMSGAAKVVTGDIDFGSVANGSGGKKSMVVTFPAGKFATPPAVVATPTNGRLTISYEADTITTTSAQINAFNWSGTDSASSTPTSWAAIGE